MQKQYLLTSTEVPRELSILIDADKPAGLLDCAIKRNFRYKLTAVANRSEAIKKVADPAIRFVAFLEGNGKLFTLAGFKWGLIGEIRKYDIGELDVVGVGGKVLGTWVDEDCPNVFPPEVFGFQRHSWWDE